LLQLQGILVLKAWLNTFKAPIGFGPVTLRRLSVLLLGRGAESELFLEQFEGVLRDQLLVALVDLTQIFNEHLHALAHVVSVHKLLVKLKCALRIHFYFNNGPIAANIYGESV
jgi:hypothetical protein